ncbi:MAG: hypothetical protein WD844_17610 [Thermoleophilaceae bacterium]
MGTRARRRPLHGLLPLIACALALAAAGCGGDDEPSADDASAGGQTDTLRADATGGESDEADAAATLESFFSALVEGDAAAACELLSEEGASYVEQGALTSSPPGGGECERVVVDSYGAPTDELLDGLEVVSTTRSTDGSLRLTFVNAATPITGAKNAVLREEAGRWKLDSAGVLSG